MTLQAEIIKFTIQTPILDKQNVIIEIYQSKKTKQKTTKESDFRLGNKNEIVSLW